jgi:hypothetical protein
MGNGNHGAHYTFETLKYHFWLLSIQSLSYLDVILFSFFFFFIIYMNSNLYNTTFQ